MLDLKLITSENLDYAVNVENEIFPEYNAKNNYLSSINNYSQSQFFLVFDKEICVGITGIYSYKKDYENAWLGFFGIKDKYRDKGYGKQALKLTEDYAKSLGYKFMRLFTDRLDNDKAINFYKKSGYTFEEYHNDEEELKDEFDVVIGSKALSDEEVPLWNNKFINLTKQSYKQLYMDEVFELDNETTSDYNQSEAYYEEKGLSKKQKKEFTMIRKYMTGKDIKYLGPLSYRYLRIIAWICFALSQFVVVLSLGQAFLKLDILSEDTILVLDLISSLSIPFFLIATFSLMLTRRNSFKKILLIYGIAYIAIALGLIFVYDRYIGGVLRRMADDHSEARVVVQKMFNKNTHLNMFGDLFFLALFNFFLNYIPTKKWSKRKMALFRSLTILPLGFALFSTIIKGLTSEGIIEFPFEVYTFLTTKPPLVYVVFIAMSLWIKNRENILIRMGATKKEYNEYIKTNRNSLAFAIFTSILFFIVSVIDLICVATIPNASFFEFGSTMGLALAIPFILLFSYTRTHKDDNFDIILPMAGIGLVVVGYIEAIYQILIYLF